MGKRTIIIGDVHGCSQELGRLVDRLEVTPDDSLVFVGDLIDKGPDSVGVVRFVRELSKRTNVVVIEGNHEDRHRRFRKWERVSLETGKKNPMSRTENLRDINGQLSDEDVTFLEDTVVFHRVPEHDVLVVHGGVPPKMRELPNLETMGGKVKKLCLQMLRLRWHDVDGNMLKLSEHDEEKDVFWGDGYDGRFGHVFFGHESFTGMEPKRFPHCTGLDTGCVYGGSLTCVVLESGHDPRFVSEKSGVCIR